MVFNSYTFILFFGVVLALHALPFSWKTKKRNLLVASYLFYAAWNPPFVLLLWLSTVVDWYVAQRIYHTGEPGRRKSFLYLSLVVNLGALAFFKYGGFLVSNLAFLLSLLHVNYHPAAPNIVLPIGISFYTFMTLAYTLDIYYRRAEPCKNFLDYALFVTFFPHLVSGPIVRASEFTPQLEKPRRVEIERVALGVGLMIIGLFEKTVLADYLLAPAAEPVFLYNAIPDRMSAWAGVLAFSGQIFYDFSGYTMCAIGAAACLGFDFPENFRAPYASLGFSDFWRRWHMSLSRWLRDYLYIPLGGNRKGNVRTYVNLMITMLLGGLWHGASWNFVIWGGLHGAYLGIERAFRSRFRTGDGEKHYVGGVGQLALVLGTFLAVTLTWVFFRAPTFPRAIQILAAMLGPSNAAAIRMINPGDVVRALGVTVFLLGTHWLMRNTTWEAVLQRKNWVAVSLCLGLMLVLILMSPGDDRAFIYFQF